MPENEKDHSGAKFLPFLTPPKKIKKKGAESFSPPLLPQEQPKQSESEPDANSGSDDSGAGKDE